MTIFTTAYESAPHLETIPVDIKTILVATDFSPTSMKAFELAIRLAREYSAKVLLSHVMVPAQATPFTGHEPQFDTCACAIRKRLSDMTKSKYTDDLLIETVLTFGAVGDEIEDIIQERGVDLLVIGTHGSQGLEKLVLGSMAEALFRNTRVPVITVGPHAGSLDMPFRHILFATDLTGRSLRAAQYAASIAEEHDAEITLVHVLPENEELSAGAASRAVEDMKQLLPKDADLWCKPTYLVQVGEPATQILRVSKDIGADLIVLAVNQPEILVDHAPWATASSVVRESSVPVLTVRNRL